MTLEQLAEQISTERLRTLYEHGCEQIRRQYASWKMSQYFADRFEPDGEDTTRYLTPLSRQRRTVLS